MMATKHDPRSTVMKAGGSGADSPDGLSLDMEPDMRQQVLKSEPMLQKALTAKIVGYYVQLTLLVVVTCVALGCLAFRVSDDNPIWPMIITYVLGYINTRGAVKAGKFARSILGTTGKNTVAQTPAAVAAAAHPLAAAATKRT